MEEGGNWLPVRNRPDGEPTMSDHDARALLIEAPDFFNDHPRFSLRRDRPRPSYELAARIDAFLAPDTAVLPILAAARDRWSSEGRAFGQACVGRCRSRWSPDN